LQLKALAPGQQIPRGLLAQGPEAIRQGKLPAVFFSSSSSADLLLFHSIVAAIGNFDQAKTLDKFNESWPKPEPSPQ
jgi:hypothetical protein